MCEIHDPESNNAQPSRSQGQTQSRPDHSASIHSHPRIMRGRQKRLAELRERLVNDKDTGIPAIESAMSLLREIDEGPFPGFTEDVIAEFECVRRELGALDPNQPSQVRQFVAIGKRLDFLSRTLSFVVGCWVPTAESNTPATTSRDDGAKR